MEGSSSNYTAPAVLNTMEEKVSEYKNFFASEKAVLIVYGLNGIVIGTAALEEALVDASEASVLAFIDGPIPTSYGNPTGSVKKVVYHLLSGEHDFMITLQRKYQDDVHITYFDIS